MPTIPLMFQLNCYSENSMDEFYKVVPKVLLPEEYGGKAGKMADLHGEYDDVSGKL